MLILIVSTALFFFFIQVTCMKLLRRRFDRDYHLAIANANRLEYLSVRKAIEEFNLPVDYARVRMTLKCDFLALTYLLKNAVNARRRYRFEEWLLMAHFRAILLWLSVCHALRLREQPLILRLTAILQYFANVVGQRFESLRFGNAAVSDYLVNL